jgi:hypothetical protein
MGRNVKRQLFEQGPAAEPQDHQLDGGRLRGTAHMGMFEVKGQVYGFKGTSAAIGSDPKSEPVSMT